MQQQCGTLSVFCSCAGGAMASQQNSFAATLLFFWLTGIMARPQGCASLMTDVLPLWQKPVQDLQ